MKKQMPDHADNCSEGPFLEDDPKAGGRKNSRHCGSTGGPFLEPRTKNGEPFLEGEGRCTGTPGGPFLEPGADSGLI